MAEDKPKASKPAKYKVLKTLIYKGKRYYPKTAILGKPDKTTNTGLKEVDTIVEMTAEEAAAYGERYVKKA